MESLVVNLKVFLGWACSKIFTHRFAKVRETFTLPYWGKQRSDSALVNLTNRLMRFYIAHSDQGRTGGEALESIHKQFWQNQIEDKWFDNSAKTFDASLVALKQPLESLRHFLQQHSHKVLCEIGTGDGRFLDHLNKTLAGFDRLIGLDLCERRIALNQDIYDGLEFVAADAQAWVPRQAFRKALFVTNGGVLEYFRPDSLDAFVREVAARGNSLALFYEPLVSDHDLDNEPDAKLTTAGEYSFSHNYPDVCRRAGLHIVSMKVDNHAGYRGICLIAQSRSPDRDV